MLAFTGTWRKDVKRPVRSLNLQPLPTISHSPLPSFHSTGWDILEDRQALIQGFQPHWKCDKELRRRD